MFLLKETSKLGVNDENQRFTENYSILQHYYNDECRFFLTEKIVIYI